MRTETQTDFSGGMVETAADGAAPANSYRYAENFDLADGRLVNRPLVGTVKYHTYGMEAVHNDGVFRFSDSAFGDCLFYVAHRPLADDSYDFCGYLLNAEGVYLSSVRIAFPELFGHADGRIYGSETEPLRTPFVFLQVGSAAYAWVTRGAAVYAFRWDGTAEGTPLAGMWQPLSTVFGAGEYVPPCRAALFAYGRVFLAVETGATGVFSSVSASAPVDDPGVPRLVFDGGKTDCGLGAVGDILGMASLGAGRIAVFKRDSVWVGTGCDGDPSGMVFECADADHGCVGHASFVTFDQGCWFVSDDGVRAVDLSGRAQRVPKTHPISGFWRGVAFAAAPDPLASAVVFGDRLLFSVYAEGAAILVYSLSAGCWVGVWSGAGMNCTGLVVGDLSTGRQLKMLGNDCTLQALSLSEPQEFSAASPGRFVSRAFGGGFPERKKLFLRSYTGLVSDATRNEGTEAEPDWQDVPAVADFRSVDADLAVTVTHLSGASMFGAVSKLCVLGRICRALSLDILFTAGTVRLRSLSVQSQPRGR
jgi:hypothetical protein